jgi:hypothetical protein
MRVRWLSVLQISISVILLALVIHTLPRIQGTFMSTKPPAHKQWRFRKDVVTYLEAPPRPLDNPAPNETTVRIDPDLENQLLSYLKQPPAQRAGPPWGAVIAIALVMAAFAVLIGLVLSRHSEATPLAIIATLAGTMVTLAPHLPSPNGRLLWIAVITLLAFGGLLLWRGAVRQWYPPGMDQRKNESLLVDGISLFVLASVLVYLAHAASVPRLPQSSPPPEHVHPVGVAVFPLTSVTGFMPGREESSDPNAVQPLVKDLYEYKVQGTDILLLLGSADCTPIKPRRGISDEILAKSRANWVAGRLNQSPGFAEITVPQIAAPLLPQHSSCTGTKNLRAVHAFLIQPKDALSRRQP